MDDKAYLCTLTYNVLLDVSIAQTSRLLEDSRTILEVIGELEPQQSTCGNMAILNVLHLDPRISFFELFLNFVESAQLSRPRDQELIAMTMKT
ncbi:predicted protein [Botrytis cinerea T4]|uniref:Uncharacterized protein n=1 Tax=Botryotinia fuckeliana (strain T4) TaxID=999810 RepID=G2YDC8_BOTF4|nr:predicted protein [Botrytis cinerea T4]